MGNQYAYVAAFGAVGVIFVIIALTVARILRPSRPSDSKSQAYECGIVPLGDAWQQFNIRYYIFALMFVLFDVEAAYLFPWAVRVGKLGLYALIEMAIFIGVLAFGLGYAWRKGGLRWE
ncbi:MAG: NADH-quinone oxidoreductase subunit A [Thermoleophilia bacterium]|nr:NADH-quinone oxidoreductase subunit A [Thermoleophilia bacterium]